MENHYKEKGFTLVELIVYVGIFAVVSGLMVGIMTTMLRVNQRESSSAEATSQLNFVMQTIQRLTKESSVIIVNSSSTNVDTDDTIGSQQTRLVLRMKDSGGAPSTDRDPIIIYAENNTIKMSEGKGAYQRTSDLTNSRVLADNLKFTKYTQYPGQDTVAIDIQLTYNSQSPDSRVSRTLRTAIARVSAATFDSNLLPGTDNQYEIGYSTNQRWKNISISNLLNLGQSSSDPIGAQNGSIYYNTAVNKIKGYASSTWASLGEWNASGTNIYYNSGNVGIGTTTPGKKLTIEVPSGASEGVMVRRTGGAGNRAELRVDGALNYGALEMMDDVGTSNVYIKAVGSSYFNGGNVGIGTTGPTATLTINTTTGSPATTASIVPTHAMTANGIALNVTNNMTNTTTDGINKYGIFLESLDPFTGGAGAATNNFGIYIDRVSGADNNYALVTTANAGKVGIGTATPTGKLTVYGVNSVGTEGLRIESNTGAYRNIYLGAGDDLYFASADDVAYLTTAGVWTNASDIAYKTNIKDMAKYGLNTVLQMKPKEYQMKSDLISQIGFIAQEMETIVPEVVSGKEGNKGIGYGQLTSVLTKAIQEQQEQIEKLKAENNSLKFRIEKLENR